MCSCGIQHSTVAALQISWVSIILILLYDGSPTIQLNAGKLNPDLMSLLVGIFIVNIILLFLRCICYCCCCIINIVWSRCFCCFLTIICYVAPLFYILGLSIVFLIIILLVRRTCFCDADVWNLVLWSGHYLCQRLLWLGFFIICTIALKFLCRVILWCCFISCCFGRWCRRWFFCFCVAFLFLPLLCLLSASPFVLYLSRCFVSCVVLCWRIVRCVFCVGWKDDILVRHLFLTARLVICTPHIYHFVLRCWHSLFLGSGQKNYHTLFLFTLFCFCFEALFV